ncbi:aryl-alcohol dehydrogenase [NADP(+)] [Cristinia sonorae]|uniref:Aryl-alcohol dehydrogenase [NADP(+)] n=1 Tax=Cristinia sonorae TaxID=1940300 RepID=A0A8K0XP08_9AGAR|nr:aryl-alcohol dehydrogenase [NADP(+)] [Cristinia sonorae]
MSLWPPAPEPATRLGRHRQFAPLAGVHLSPLVLGGMSVGDGSWGILGHQDKEKSFQLLDAFYQAGGNTIDTASNYQDESSERIIGEWMETRGIRDQIVIATKYTSNFKRAEGPEFGQKTQYTGNNIKALHVSIEASLKKLRTDYIDILYVHWWDYSSSIEEVMNGLHHLVAQGKVLYLGVSDTPAWIVSRANTYARLTGKTPFVVYQGPWNIFARDLERDILPMARMEGMAIMPWNVLASGKIRSDAEEERRRKSGENGYVAVEGTPWERTPEQREVCLALEKVAGEVGAQSITSVAIAYIMQKSPYVFPIVGGRKVEQLKQNIEALEISLSNDQIVFLDNASPFHPGFPTEFFGDGSSYNFLAANAGHFDRWPAQQAIRPISKK